METHDYEWDVFLSYRRTNTVKRWMLKAFYDPFCEFLHEYIPTRKPSIFLDEKQYPGIQNPTDGLYRGLKASRCLVAVLTPTYFHSGWCLAEWKTFVQRAQFEKEQRNARPTLISAVRLQDCEHHTQGLQLGNHNFEVFRHYYTCDFRDEKAWQHARRLSKAIDILAKSVAGLITAAPKFDASWPIMTINPDEDADPRIVLPQM